jgi:hypothetical protein
MALLRTAATTTLPTKVALPGLTHRAGRRGRAPAQDGSPAVRARPHRRRQVLQVDAYASLILEGIAQSGAAVHPQRHAHGMAQFRAVRVHLERVRQLA